MLTTCLIVLLVALLLFVPAQFCVALISVFVPMAVTVIIIAAPFIAIGALIMWIIKKKKGE